MTNTMLKTLTPSAPPKSIRLAGARGRQRGAFMLEISLALVITAIASAATIRTQLNANRMQTADIQADVLNIYRNALQTYTDENFYPLMNGTPVTKGAVTLAPGNALGQSMQPDIPNLITMGYLPQGFTNNVILVDGAGFQNRIGLEPVGCVLPACNVRGYAYIDQAIVVRNSGGETDGTMIGQMLARIGGNAGTSVEGSVASITGVGAAWNWPNPVAGAPAGVVAARFGFDSSALSQFVRINDTRDPSLQGNLSALGNLAIGGTSTLAGALTVNNISTFNGNISVNNAGVPCVNLDKTGVISIACAGLLNAKNGIYTDGVGNTTQINPTGVVATGVVSANGGFTTPGASAFVAADPNAIRVNAGDFFVRGTSGTLLQATALGDVIAGKDLIATNNVQGNVLQLNTTVNEGNPCAGTEVARLAGGGVATCVAGTYRASTRISTEGAVCSNPGTSATDLATSKGLVCKGGVWSQIDAFLSPFRLTASYVVTDNTPVLKPVAANAGVAQCPITGPSGMLPLIILVPKDDDLSYDRSAARYTVDGGTFWTVHIQNASDNTSQGASAAIALVYCFYPGT